MHRPTLENINVGLPLQPYAAAMAALAAFLRRRPAQDWTPGPGDGRTQLDG